MSINPGSSGKVKCFPVFLVRGGSALRWPDFMTVASCRGPRDTELKIAFFSMMTRETGVLVDMDTVPRAFCITYLNEYHPAIADIEARSQ